MPSLRPDPDGSGVVTTIQSANRAVAGPSTLATLPSDSTRARSASLRVYSCPVRPIANGTSLPITTRCRKHGGEDVGHVDFGVGLADDLAVALDTDVEPAARQRRCCAWPRTSSCWSRLSMSPWRRRRLARRGRCRGPVSWRWGGWRHRHRRRGRRGGAGPMRVISRLAAATSCAAFVRSAAPPTRVGLGRRPLGGFALRPPPAPPHPRASAVPWRRVWIPCTMPSIRWLTSLGNSLPLFRSQRFGTAFGNDLAEHLAPDRREIDHQLRLAAVHRHGLTGRARSRRRASRQPSALLARPALGRAARQRAALVARSAAWARQALLGQRASADRPDADPAADRRGAENFATPTAQMPVARRCCRRLGRWCPRRRRGPAGLPGGGRGPPALPGGGGGIRPPPGGPPRPRSP